MSLRVGLCFAALLIAGCGWGSAESIIQKDRRERRDQLADVQARVDLAIAQSDLTAVEGGQIQLDNTMKALQNAITAKDTDGAERLSKQVDRLGDELDKAIDRAARHRCSR